MIYTFLALRSSRVSIFLGAGVSAGSCVHQNIKIYPSHTRKGALQTLEEIRILPCTAKVSSRVVTCPAVQGKELAL